MQTFPVQDPSGVVQFHRFWPELGLSLVVLVVLAGFGLSWGGPEWLIPWSELAMAAAVALAVLAVGVVVWLARWNRQLSVALRRARMETRRMQLDPHFVCNALVAAKVGRSERGVPPEKAIDCLAAYFNHMNQHREAGFCTVEEEVAFLQEMLRLQQLRFGSELEVAVEVDPAARRLWVPSLLLQPLVENAVKHGGADATGVRRVAMKVALQGASLVIEVANTGEWAPVGVAGGGGFGLDYVRSQLADLWPGRHEFTVVSTPGWVRMELVLPAIMAPVEAGREVAGE